MLHEALADYLEKIERAILQCGNAYVERYIEEIVTSERANLRILHFPGLLKFPQHKHLPDDVIPARKPEIEQVVQEAMSIQA